MNAAGDYQGRSWLAAIGGVPGGLPGCILRQEASLGLWLARQASGREEKQAGEKELGGGVADNSHGMIVHGFVGNVAVIVVLLSEVGGKGFLALPTADEKWASGSR